MTKTAIVILNWNGLHYLQKFIQPVITFSDYPGTEVIVVDNNSTDGSVEFMRKEYPVVRLIIFDKNYGFAPGYYKALQSIEAEYFVLLNSDVEVTPGWLTPVIQAMEKNKTIGACMPKMRAYEQKEYFEYAGAAGGFIDSFGYPFCRGRILSSIEKDTGQYDEQMEIFWASGACMFVRASAYFEAGGLDSSFFAHMEEIDLCWRIKRLEYKILCIPQSTVFHVGGGTLPNNNPRKIYLNYRNSLFLLFKNLPLFKMFPVVLSRISLDIMSATIYLCTASFGFFWAVVRAHLSFYRQLPLLCRQRKMFKKRTGMEKVDNIYHGSIVVSFFIRKIKTFDKLNFK